jgi:hypothetical protein
MKRLSVMYTSALLISACATALPVQYSVVMQLPPRPPDCRVQSYGPRRPPGAQVIAWFRLDCGGQGAADCEAEFNKVVCQDGGNAVFWAHDESAQASRDPGHKVLAGTIALVPE